MPDEKTTKKARADMRSGKAPTTRSTKQAIAIGLSKARRAGVPLPPPSVGTSRRARSAAKRRRARKR